ncbi:leucine-rich repeat-containing protein 56 isoform X1 [Acipenser ruthenus]|uniref:leucine-rich repeat-containing protein 56 isoform X1 n=2 Tax=Acipenser ruthenus TaxID=7906 RepID=UPI002740457A|nr:leucine-rich repeat-containing protein 56 isoform X1 [Acipenser ruthenus]XP_058858859.1 leucine-rich repeat-containing protein 56 isoform X1 [Acipenser ruthenus]XP_058858860.1 leucine-rich repeat-containing protein 56 isoform X1 [Acipenser ruthenus]
MESHQDPLMRPGTARVWVTEFSGSAVMNPSPDVYEDNELLVDEYLSPEKLQALAGIDDLRLVKVLEMCVDTRENSLGNIGTYLPNLMQLKMSNSLIVSVRDLGTTLSHLQVLWMARCGLSDLDGIPSFCSLKELYLAYNDISDMSQVSMLDHLEILDLEGNNIDDITQVQYLGLCDKLSMLTLEGNPICLRPHPYTTKSSGYSYRAAVKELVPHLKYLDDIPADHSAAPRSNKLNEDWMIVKQSIKDCNSTKDTDNQDESVASGRPSSGQHPHSSRPGSARRPWTAQRPASAGMPGSNRPLSAGGLRPGSAGSDETTLEEDASDLTHGVGRVICGNPIKALRARRQKQNLASPSPPNPFAHYSHKPEHTFDVELENRGREDIFAELKAWRMEHNKRLDAIQKEREPQVLKISHSDDEEGEQDRYSLSDSAEEDEIKGDLSDDWTARASPDSSFQSSGYPSPPPPPPPPVALNLSPSPPVCPSPPCPPGAPSGVRRTHNLRARRLKIPDLGQHEGVQGLGQGTGTPPFRAQTGALHTDENFALLDQQNSTIEVVRPKVHQHLRASLSSMESTRPISGPAAVGPRIHKTAVDRSPQKPIDTHQPIIRSSVKTPERPCVPHAIRPLTAKAALQRLPNRPALIPGRGNTDSS